MADLNVKFVAQKISKIRWMPMPKDSLQRADTFATGSWDDEVNKVSIWKIGQPFPIDQSMGDSALFDHEPQVLCEVDHFGDVTDLSYLTRELIAAASSTGAVTVFKHHTNSQTLSQACWWEGQEEECASTCLARLGEDSLAAGTESGQISILTLGQHQPTRIIDGADSCTINDITSPRQSEVLTVNSFGQLKIFDLRSNQDKPSKTYSVAEEHVSLHCVDTHSGQSHVVATGGQDGMLTIWDLRQDRFPMTLLEAHSSTMWEVKFHPTKPDHLFTCSEDGSLWHWDGSAMIALPMSVTTGSLFPAQSGLSNVSPWLQLETARHKLEITSLLPNKSLPVNSIDVQASLLLCGTDSETIYTVDVPALR